VKLFDPLLLPLVVYFYARSIPVLYFHLLVYAFLLSLHSFLRFAHVTFVLAFSTILRGWVKVPVGMVILENVPVVIHYIYCNCWPWLHVWIRTAVSFPCVSIMYSCVIHYTDKSGSLAASRTICAVFSSIVAAMWCASSTVLCVMVVFTSYTNGCSHTKFVMCPFSGNCYILTALVCSCVLVIGYKIVSLFVMYYKYCFGWYVCYVCFLFNYILVAL
jgi:hypothetical protein